jgi:branched-chain amino acid transport system ATP-binding protein
MLEVNGIDLVYANHYQVLWDVSMRVDEGEIVCILGPNGAGKSSLMNTISGLRKPNRGSITLRGTTIGGVAPHRINRLGLAHVLERRRLFPSLTVRDNLLLGASTAPAKERNERLAWVLEMIPVAEPLLGQIANTMSGGQQQMVAIARGLMGRPQLLMCDEPFLGLSPAAMGQVLQIFTDIRTRGITILFIEQNVQQALEVSDRGYILESGRVALEGPAQELLATKSVQEVYLGEY